MFSKYAAVNAEELQPYTLSQGKQTFISASNLEIGDNEITNYLRTGNILLVFGKQHNDRPSSK